MVDSSIAVFGEISYPGILILLKTIIAAETFLIDYTRTGSTNIIYVPVSENILVVAEIQLCYINSDMRRNK